jgi:DNA polymerase-3 subunit gamma/tau
MSNPYKVLALKYRPDSFADLIGQEVLVQTLTNAINTNRLANAFLLTGIRGVGKTTTARIIARALNCTGIDGKGAPTVTPCGVCANCKSIKESRHPDIMEMDAASRTGVDDIREIIDNSRYLPTSARYKIFIIDEVHMLSKNAFNALLKTLEEPPAHVKFIFATTEIRKIPITILSRCQRFDLRRVENEILVPHLTKIASNESATIEREAIEMIANASEGSVRDSLSLLDQAISHSEGTVTAQITRDMLGLADKTKVIDIFDNIAKGETAAALEILKELYDASADPVLVLNDLLEYSYLVTKLKVMPKLNLTGLIPENEYQRAKEMSVALPMSYLTRCWQMLLKGISEAKNAPNTFSAAEMILVRLAYLSDLPSPAAIINNMQKNNTTARPMGTGAPSAPVSHAPSGNIAANPMTIPAYDTESETLAYINNFNELAELFNLNKEALLYNWLLSEVHLIRFEQGRLELSLSSHVSPDFIKRVSQCLRDWTGKNWVVVASHAKGQSTLQEKRDSDKEVLKKQLANQPNISKILEIFPGAYISKFEEK